MLFEAENQAEMFVRQWDLPDRSHFDFTVSDHRELHPSIPLSSAGTYSIHLHGLFGALGGESFELAANLPRFEITSLDSGQGSNAGEVTASVTGSGLTPATAIDLTSGGVVQATGAVVFVDPNHLFATFDLSVLEAGPYDVSAIDGANEFTLDNGFVVTESTPANEGRIKVRITVPRFVRPKIRVNYRNMGESDVEASWYVLEIDKGSIARADGSSGTMVHFLSISPDGPAGTLRPGAENTLCFTIQGDRHGSNLRGVTLQRNGGFKSAPNDYGELAAEGDGYRLEEKSGVFMVFDADGTLNYVTMPMAIA